VTRLLVLLLTIGAATTASAQSLFNSAPTSTRPHPAVARIVVPERDGTTYGSGALVAVNESSGLVLTNWHVVRDSTGLIIVWFPDGFNSGAYLLRVDRTWDLAALAIRRPNIAPIPVSSVAPQPGEPLTIAGYGSGSYRAITGRLTQYVSPGENQPFEMVELSAPARNGDSGGPILNSRGELAGTLFGSAYGRTTGSYCGRLRWFLNSTDGDFQRVSAQALLAQQGQRGPAPVTAISAGLTTTAPAEPQTVSNEKPIYSTLPPAGPPAAAPAASTAVVSAGRLAPVSFAAAPAGAVPTASAPVAAVPASPLGTLPNSDQIRTILAAAGIIAVLYHALRMLGWALG
jgi:hypothetical protein